MRSTNTTPPTALGTASTKDTGFFATAAQGTEADTALQSAGAFATAAQGAKADTALQNAAAFATASQGTKADSALQDGSVFATSAQGAKADSALQTQTMTWTKYTKTFTNLSAAALTNDIELFQLAAKEMIHAVLIKASTAFSGGTIATYTVSVGPTGTLAKYGIALDVKQATGATVFGMNLLPGIESFSGATSIRIAAISTIANLNAATAGSVDVFVLKSTLP